LMLIHVYPHARRFKSEMPGHRAAMLSLRNHSLIVSKQPGDIFRLHRLKNHYAARSAQLRPIVLVRDPRDVLTSHHSGRPDRPYFLTAERWHRYDEYVSLHRQTPDTLFLKYEELVADVATVQSRMEAFIGEPMSDSIASFHSDVPATFRDKAALNGVRAVDSQGIGRWRNSRHASRVRQILDALPDFPQRLIELGYEQNDDWTREYQSQAA
jgi:hypothetical protein